jgi:hypothetical protein
MCIVRWLELDFDTIMSSDEKQKIYAAIGYDGDDTSTSTYPDEVDSNVLPFIVRDRSFACLVRRCRSCPTFEYIGRDDFIETQRQRCPVNRTMIVEVSCRRYSRIGSRCRVIARATIPDTSMSFRRRPAMEAIAYEHTFDR